MADPMVEASDAMFVHYFNIFVGSCVCALKHYDTCMIHSRVLVHFGGCEHAHEFQLNEALEADLLRNDPFEENRPRIVGKLPSHFAAKMRAGL